MPEVSNEYVQDLEDTVDRLTTTLENGYLNGCWYDKYQDGDIKKPIIRSNFMALGVCVAYVILVGNSWSVYYLRREDTKKFSGYRFCRLVGGDNKPRSWDNGKSPLDIAKSLAIRTIR